jgi:L-malate glycosyltransferase
VRAFLAAAQKLPELRLFLLGSGSQAALLRQMVEHSGFQERVYWGGQVSQANLPGFYRASDLYISASHSDGSSVSLMEALASALPVLLSDIPTNREWVTPGEQGWLFKDGDWQDLADAIAAAASQRSQLTTKAQAARKLAEQRADWSRNFKELLRAYAMALQPAGVR